MATTLCRQVTAIFGTPTTGRPVTLFDQAGSPANQLPNLPGAIFSDHGYISFTKRSCDSSGIVRLKGRQLAVVTTGTSTQVVGSSFTWVLHARNGAPGIVDAQIEELPTGQSTPILSNVYATISSGQVTFLRRERAETLYPEACARANPARGCSYEVNDAISSGRRTTQLHVFTFDDAGALITLLLTPNSVATTDPS